MRDLGLMGENFFSSWCASSGLVANKSHVDKTGWDFYVEFPFEAKETDIHQPALECKVQVKSTDKTDKKLQITLSNLKRLATAHMPSFFIFIEFGGEEMPKNAYLVHVDNSIITNVLTKIHQISQNNEVPNLHKKTLTIKYNDSHKLENLNGECLLKNIKKHIGNDMGEYIFNKKLHLGSTGFENGAVNFKFLPKGQENLKNFIDASIGIKKKIEVSRVLAKKTRFGITEKDAFIDSKDGVLEIFDLQPTAEGTIRFKYEKLSPGLLFKVKIYISPLNMAISEKLSKARIDGEFFEFIIPHTGDIEFNFTIDNKEALDIRTISNRLKLLNIIGKAKEHILTELTFDDKKTNLSFSPQNIENEIDFSAEEKTVDYAIKILSYFEVTEQINTSLLEILTHEKSITTLGITIEKPINHFKVDFNINEDEIDIKSNIAYISTLTTKIGPYRFMLLAALTGTPFTNQNNKISILTNDITIEKKISSREDDPITKEDLLVAIKTATEKYNEKYLVITPPL